MSSGEPERGTVITPAVAFDVELRDPLGTPCGHGVIVMDSQTFPADPHMDEHQLAMWQTASKLGQYVQREPWPNEHMPAYMVVTLHEHE